MFLFGSKPLPFVPGWPFGIFNGSLIAIGVRNIRVNRGARALFGPLYYTGLPFARVPAWAVAWVATAYIAVVVLLNA